MIFGIQIIGVLFSVIMIYFTFLFYKRANYEKTGLVFWFLVWTGFAILIMFPQIAYGIMGVLAIERTADFMYASGMLVFSVILFYLFNITKQTQKKVEMLVRKTAIRDALTEEKEKKRKKRKK